MKRALVLLAFAASAAASPAQRQLIVENRADQPIFQLYVEPVNPACWCEDVLGDAIVEPGKNVKIDLGSDRSCRYDLLAVMKDRTRIPANNVDLCAGGKWVVGPGTMSRME